MQANVVLAVECAILVTFITASTKIIELEASSDALTASPSVWVVIMTLLIGMVMIRGNDSKSVTDTGNDMESENANDSGTDNDGDRNCDGYNDIASVNDDHNDKINEHANDSEMITMMIIIMI